MCTHMYVCTDAHARTHAHRTHTHVSLKNPNSLGQSSIREKSQTTQASLPGCKLLARPDLFFTHITECPSAGFSWASGILPPELSKNKADPGPRGEVRLPASVLSAQCQPQCPPSRDGGSALSPASKFAAARTHRVKRLLRLSPGSVIRASPAALQCLLPSPPKQSFQRSYHLLMQVHVCQ